MGSWAVCEPALEPLCEWEGLRTRCQDFKPDLGNSAVEHDQGGLRKRSHGGNANPTRKRKSELGNPPPTAGASELSRIQSTTHAKQLCTTSISRRPSFQRVSESRSKFIAFFSIQQVFQQIPHLLRRKLLQLI